MREFRVLLSVLVLGGAIWFAGGCKPDTPAPPPPTTTTTAETGTVIEPLMQGCPCCPISLTATGGVDIEKTAKMVLDSVPCCPCYTEATSTGESIDRSTPAPLAAGGQPSVSLERTFSESGMAVITGFIEVLRNPASQGTLPMEFVISMEGAGGTPTTRSQRGRVPGGSATTVVQLRETFDVAPGTRTFKLRAQSAAATADDLVGTRVIQLTFLPDAH